MIIDSGYYKDGVRQGDGQPISLAQAAAFCERDEGFVWVGVKYSDDGELDELQKHFNLHELAVADSKHAHNRPKLEAYDDSYFVVLRTARYLDKEERVEFGEIHIFVAARFVITVRHGEASDLHVVREKLEARPDLLAHGPAAVLWGATDKVVDDYQPVVQGIDLDIEEVEHAVFVGNGEDPTQRIYLLRRELGEFYRSVHPLQAPLDAVENGMYPQMEPLAQYFRDINDHVKIVVEEVIAHREALGSVLDANIALITERQNEVVRIISAWAAMIAVPTLIASVYGMNFRNMPELDWQFGYPLAMAVMAFAAAVLYTVFKRSRWL